LHVASIRTIPWDRSIVYATAAGVIGWVKEGHPEWDSNFVSASNNRSPQQAQA